jgi:hypothetical protein
MQKIVVLSVLVFLAVGCATKVPYTDKIREEFELEEAQLKKVQFFTSSEIIMYRASTSGSKATQEGGVLVQSSHSKQDRIIIPPNTKCVLEKLGDSGEIMIRFESGAGRYLSFKGRPSSGNRYFLNAEWKDGKGSIQYANEVYEATSVSGNAFLLVQIKKLQKTQRQDRIVRGVKVN